VSAYKKALALTQARHAAELPRVSDVRAPRLSSTLPAHWRATLPCARSPNTPIAALIASPLPNSRSRPGSRRSRCRSAGGRASTLVQRRPDYRRRRSAASRGQRECRGRARRVLSGGHAQRGAGESIHAGWKLLSAPNAFWSADRRYCSRCSTPVSARRRSPGQADSTNPEACTAGWCLRVSAGGGQPRADPPLCIAARRSIRP